MTILNTSTQTTITERIDAANARVARLKAIIASNGISTASWRARWSLETLTYAIKEHGVSSREVERIGMYLDHVEQHNRHPREVLPLDTQHMSDVHQCRTAALDARDGYEQGYHWCEACKAYEDFDTYDHDFAYCIECRDAFHCNELDRREGLCEQCSRDYVACIGCGEPTARDEVNDNHECKECSEAV